MSYEGAHGLSFDEIKGLCKASYSTGLVQIALDGAIWRVGDMEEGIHSYRVLFVRRARDKKNVILFRGTQSPIDWIHNIAMALGNNWAPQYVFARQFLNRYLKSYDPGDIVLVGHSLGGGLAAKMALEFGLRAATIFPAPILRIQSLNLKKASVVNYVCVGEILTSLALPFNLSAHRRIGKDIWIHSRASDPFSKHTSWDDIY